MSIKLYFLRPVMQLLFLSCVLAVTAALAVGAPVKAIIFPVQDLGRNEKWTPLQYDAQAKFTRDAYETAANNGLEKLIIAAKPSANVEFVPQARLAAITDPLVKQWYLAQIKAPSTTKTSFDLDKIKRIISKQTGATVFIAPTLTVALSNNKPTMLMLEYWISDSRPDSLDEQYNMISKIDYSYDEMMSDLLQRFFTALPEQVAAQLQKPVWK